MMMMKQQKEEPAMSKVPQSGRCNTLVLLQSKSEAGCTERPSIELRSRKEVVFDESAHTAFRQESGRR